MSFFTTDFKKDFEFDVKSLFFCFLVNSVVKVQLTAAKPPAERSEANKVSFYLYMFSAEGEQLFFTYGGEAAGRAKRGY